MKRIFFIFTGLALLIITVLFIPYENLIQPASKSSLVSQTPTHETLPTPSPVLSQAEEPDLESLNLELRNYLQNQEYSKLNKKLDELLTASLKDVSYEDEMFKAYSAFDIESADYEPLFNTWVEKHSNQYQPYLARANYFYTMAWQARGGKFASETEQQQFDRMRAFFEKAATDIKTALESNSQAYIAHEILIGILGSQSGPNQLMREVLRAAVEIQPATYRVRLKYLHFITPRWGGSFEQMESFVNESLKHVNQNSKLNLLEARIYTEAAYTNYLDRKYSAAEELYNKALSYGHRAETYLDRGKTRYKRENYRAALEDLNKAISLNTDNAEYYYWRSQIHSKLEDYDSAVSDIALAKLLAPWDKNILSERDWLADKMIRLGYELNRSGEQRAAIEKFTAALSLDPNRADAYYRKAKAHIKLNKLEPALDNVKLAIEYDPHSFGYYQLLDWILAQRKDWDQIISYWDRYIALRPDDDAAYVERGGAYYHKGDMHSAVADAKTAADMGNPRGQQAYDRFKHLAD
ncbi:tetratricopeptide repeat protein [Thiohalophilus sp.]|uniref:tetratricopeptide repeat protein n=1 Tax=Thiohalophilus sp. TaxID=3028392 RepID=UPI002ACD5EFE|nr:tetratricopeptide repeat protein [Thiohalophilus sp.]MDZ7660896.1 tetratricopeptide repeat protein [Thiohalophilus sp.]